MAKVHQTEILSDADVLEKNLRDKWFGELEKSEREG